jgi:hypothetical protein
VEISIPVLAGLAGLSLKIGAQAVEAKGYPSRRLQKGLVLFQGDQELAEEGVGFGVPVLKRGIQTIFPGDVEVASQRRGAVWEVTAVFRMNLEERIAVLGRGSLRSRRLYGMKNSLAALHRRVPLVRGPLTAASSGLRWMFGWETTYEEADFDGSVKVVYTVHGEAGRVIIEVDTAGVPLDRVSEVVVMNEQGARRFDRYRDSDGTCLQGDEIGTWDNVAAAEASFVSETGGLAFTLGQVPGARLFRGREMVGLRLSWAGFGYSLTPPAERFSYVVRIEQVL